MTEKETAQTPREIPPLLPLGTFFLFPTVAAFITAPYNHPMVALLSIIVALAAWRGFWWVYVHA